MIYPMSPLGFRIRELRLARQWSQAQLAEKVGVRQATISGLETGRTRRVDLDTIDALARALGVQPGELLERVPDRKGKRG